MHVPVSKDYQPKMEKHTFSKYIIKCTYQAIQIFLYYIKIIIIFRHGKALEQLGEYDEAMKALQKAHYMAPGTEEIRKQIQKVCETCDIRHL